MDIYRHLRCPSSAWGCPSVPLLPPPLHLPSASLHLSPLWAASPLLGRQHLECGPDRLQRPLAAPWRPGVLEHTGGALSARPQAADADPARRGHRKMPVTAWPVHGSRIIATSELSSYGAPPAVSLPAGNPARQGPTLLLCRRGKRGWERWTACLNYLCREQQTQGRRGTFLTTPGGPPRALWDGTEDVLGHANSTR